MLQKSWIFIALILPSFMAWTQPDPITCPSVQDIKEQDWIEWQPLYIEGEELASYQDVETFKKHVTRFTVAKWSATYLESGHCFYQGTDPILDRIVYAHDAWQPVTNTIWSWLFPGKYAECRSEHVEDCSFIL